MKITRRRLLETLGAVAAAGVAQRQQPGASASFATVATHDFFNPGATNSGVRPYTFGQGFRMGDLAAGTYPLVTDSRDGQLTYQLDEISPKWPDGSMRHCVISAMVPADASRACTRLKIKKTTAPYAPSSTPRSAADFTTRNFLVHYRNVLTNPTAAGFPSSWTVNWSRKGSNRGNLRSRSTMRSAPVGIRLSRTARCASRSGRGGS